MKDDRLDGVDIDPAVLRRQGKAGGEARAMADLKKPSHDPSECLAGPVLQPSSGGLEGAQPLPKPDGPAAAVWRLRGVRAMTWAPGRPVVTEQDIEDWVQWLRDRRRQRQRQHQQHPHGEPAQTAKPRDGLEAVANPMSTGQMSWSREPHPQPELRAQYLKAMKQHRREVEKAEAAGLSWPDPGYPRGPDLRMFDGLMCGAKGKRTGKPCPLTGIHENGRCRWHGGMSTGPTSEQGKARSATNGLQPKRTP